MAAPPESVAAVVERALTDRRPMARYLTGAAALMTAVLRRALPTRDVDTVTGVMMGLPTRVAD
ncbi:hypothetical protein [Promicromonospora sp. NPDC050880]|uniref:hypothetical protein n=1 Tax=Promicromonospora sp. NPDC050880 TaxID=3364406 RepID=UPI0037A9E5E6